MRRLGLLVALLAVGCDHPSGATPSAVEQPASAESPTHSSAARGAALAFRWRQVHGRLSEVMPRPAAFEELSCPDDRIRRTAPSPAGRRLTLAVDDARYGARSLMPVAMTKTLESPHVARLETLLSPPSKAHSPSFSFGSREAAEDTARLLDELDQRAFKGVFSIIQYKKPHLIRKKGKLRREWLPGLLQAWLVVYEIDTSEVLCSTRIVVLSEVEDAPVWLRTKAGTQNRLIRELGDAMLLEGQRSLAEISSALTLETAAIETSDGAQRVADAQDHQR